MIRWLGLVFLVGCVDTSPWEMPESGLRPLARADAMSWWRPVVERAAETWNDALAPLGCEPAFFVSAEGEHPVLLVEPQYWNPDDSRWVSTFETARIQVKELGNAATVDGDARRVMVGALVHELGHAMGLGHTDDRPSVMTTWLSLDTPTAADAELAARVIGCR